MVEKVRAEDAVGRPLAHDVVRYGPGLKSVLFKRGYVVTQEDVERLKDTGNYFVFVAERGAEGVHEEEAAIRMARASMGENVFFSKPFQGKVNLLAKTSGLLKVRADVLRRVNLMDDFIIAARQNDSGVRKGGLVGSVKIVPLAVDEKRMKKVEEILKRGKPVLRIIPPKVKKIGVIVTGTEVHEGRVEDAFAPALNAKLAGYGVRVQEKVVVPDDEGMIREKILEFKKRGFELILVTGGMAVDAGDVTPSAIKKTGGKVVSWGVPTFPGSMAMVAYLGSTVILGLPACVIPDKMTSFDVLLPKVLAKEKITRGELAGLGHGGLL